MKLILLHTCEKGELLAVNPEIILEMGNDYEETEEHRPEDEVRILQSHVPSLHEARLYLASRPFRVGDRIEFRGLTHVTQLNDVETSIRASSSPLVAGFQVTMGAQANELVVTNNSILFTLRALGTETGYLFKLQQKIKCGFFACCGGERIETKESLQEILEALVTAGIATVHDPEGHLVTPSETDRP